MLSFRDLPVFDQPVVLPFQSAVADGEHGVVQVGGAASFLVVDTCKQEAVKLFFLCMTTRSSQTTAMQ